MTDSQLNSSPAGLFTAADWLTMLEVSLTAIQLARPLFAPDGHAIIDFALDYTNPAGQRMTGLTGQPGSTLLDCFPHAQAEGVFAYYQRVFETGELLTYEVNYQEDGLDNYFRFSARRSGERLLVSFTDTTEQPRTAVEVALRASQAAERAAGADAEAQRQRFYEVLMQLPAQVATYHGPDHVFSFVNPRYQAYFPGQALLGRPLQEALPEALAQGFVGLLDHVFQTGEPYYSPEQEFWLGSESTRPPEQLFLNAFFCPLRDAQGRIDGLLDFSYDVTEQVRARRQVEQLNQQLEARVQERTQDTLVALGTAERERTLLQTVLTQAPVAIGLFQGEELRITAANAQMAAIWGRTPEQVLSQPLLDAVPELRGQGFDEQLRQVLRTQVPVRGTETPAVMLRDGQLQTTYYTFVYQPLYDTEGRVLGVIDVAVEVTEQVLVRQQIEQLNQELEARVQERTQQTEQARAEAEIQRQRFYDLLMLLPANVAVNEGPDQVFTLVNPGYQRQAPGLHLLGKPIRQVWPELVDHGILDELGRVYQTGEPFTATEMPVQVDLTRTGQLEQGYYTFFFLPLRDAQGQLNGVLNFSYNVTDSVVARQQVERLNKELETRVQARTEELAAVNNALTTTNKELFDSNRQLTRSNVDLDTFVYTASHDLKAPITNIESILLALRDTLPAAVQQDEVVAHLLDLLNQTVGRFQLTIGQLTDISRLQLVHAGPAEPVVLARVVENVRLDLVPAIGAADVRLSVEVAPDLVVSFSPANLRSIIYNLLSNAVKYRALDRPAQVRVHAAQTASEVMLTVQDNGLGMSAVQQRQLFGLFQRLHTHVEGTGVGLYITKRLIENAGGTITVQSQPGVGTIFTVTLPT
ncbi:PAS domain-containing protein [Hymenobacter sp. GOD-10R]|uniref:PAS domain-containing protein n=1 Tax=Hymenobacter sp. GOD-10R TaxID=3093922 RepID=UPI002D7A001A|nr:PAS domain-containing protein [Hymenobacter sp. GOD-10R]WRQ31574.1 PAS domain-containing protein [Hymenobacter sp. GOD-10R]